MISELKKNGLIDMNKIKMPKADLETLEKQIGSGGFDDMIHMLP